MHKFFQDALGRTGGESPAVFNWYADFIRGVGIPNEQVFSVLVAYGEVLVGVALILGLFTKWAAFWAAFLNLNYSLAGAANANGYLLAPEVAMVFGGLGVSYYGLDSLVLPRLRGWWAERRGRTPQAAPRLAGTSPPSR